MIIQKVENNFMKEIFDLFKQITVMILLCQKYFIC